MRWNSRSIKVSNLKINTSTAFSTFTVSYSCHLYLVPKHFHYPQTLYPLSRNSCSLFPQLLATTNLSALWTYWFWISHMNGVIWYVTFCIWLLSHFIFWHVCKVHACSIWLNNNSLWYRHATVCLPIHPSVDIWVFSTFWLLWIIWLWTWTCKYLSPCLQFF